MTDPACVIAVTGNAGLGKSTVVAGVLGELGMTAWIVSAALDDLTSVLALIQQRVTPNFVLVIDDADAMQRPLLDGLFDALARDRAALPRVVIVGRRPFWSAAERPGGCGPHRCIGTVAVLFAMTEAEAEHYLRHTLGRRPPQGSGLTVRAAVQQAQGSARALQEATKSWPRAAVASARPPALTAKRGEHFLSGTMALIILVLALVALTMSVVDTTPSRAPQILGTPSISEPRAAILQ